MRNLSDIPLLYRDQTCIDLFCYRRYLNRYCSDRTFAELDECFSFYKSKFVLF